MSFVTGALESLSFQYPVCTILSLRVTFTETTARIWRSNDEDQSQKIDSYKMSTSWDKTEALPASLKLSVGDSQLDNTGTYHIVGEVTNQENQNVTFVKISGAFYISNTT